MSRADCCFHFPKRRRFAEPHGRPAPVPLAVITKFEAYESCTLTTAKAG